MKDAQNPGHVCLNMLILRVRGNLLIIPELQNET